MQDLPNRQLLVNYLLGLCTPNEVQAIENWLDQDPENVSLLERIAKDIRHEKKQSYADTEEIKKQLFSNIKPDKQEGATGRKDIRPAQGIKTNSWLRVAAIILLILTAGGVGFYYMQTPLEENTSLTYKERTLSAGQKATFRFGDGSVIYLNAGSSLRYPSKFSRNKREIYLEGEAFFSVVRDTSRPFIVHAGNTVTKVLGTSFNINAYKSGEKVQVAVAEGKVAVSKEKVEENDDGKYEPVFLTKNQWVTYHPSGNIIERGEGSIRELIAWKDKVLMFNDRPLKDVVTRLERWYNINITIADTGLASRRLSASFEDEPLAEVLTVIALSLDMKYEREGREITFSDSK
ncbi:FecR family protein [Fodinibius salsisoli]|uniref:FecR domain-containing protein n=1 Tax=Fodinibius salsisoli TaxID=2820877 RepID=A0ABT3PJC4_9BACT|nr:FecR domain-containing protein [Fodinibius salsisoli]MCW9705970.1 FecR domain-containing protein [Fodinibius salsisoli]